MEELVKVIEHNGKQLVSARELHEFLESKERFSKWWARMVEYGFNENIDYSSVQKGTLSLLSNDYACVLDMAKHISMIQRSKKGMMARNYFIAMEKKLLSQLPQTFSQALQIAADAQRKLEEQAPKIAVHDTITNSNKLSNVSQVAALFGMSRTSFYKWLRKNKYIQMQINKPYQKHIDDGLLDFRIDNVNNQNYYVTLITGKGITIFGHLIEK